MRKAIVALIMIGLLSLTAPASDLRSPAEILLLETALPAVTLFPLAILDLLPDPAPKAAYATLYLDPSQVLIDPDLHYFARGRNGATFGDTTFDASLGVLVALNVADYFSTNAALKYSGLAEFNPVSKLLGKNPYVFTAIKIGFTAFSYWGIKSLYKHKKTLAWFLSTAANFAFSYVVFSNLQLIKMAKNR